MSEKSPTIEIRCLSADPIEVRAENIVKAIGFRGGDGGGYSIPKISPQDATLRAMKVLRMYEQVDAQSVKP